ncbi:MAG TPA: choice-of-anchor tandem repeat GloVer-containing protein [Candidatus Sulfotelmatobacter sp.]
MNRIPRGNSFARVAKFLNPVFIAVLAEFTIFIALAAAGEAQTVTTLYNLNAGTGSNPVANLIQGRDGNLWGTARFGGENAMGTVFKVSTGGRLTVVHSFAGSDGAYPEAGLLLGVDGNFYGTTANGGSANFGVVFKMTPAGDVTVLHAFTGTPDGGIPYSSPILASDGNLYGVTDSGGSTNNNAGVVYRIPPSGKYTVIYNYSLPVGSGEDFSPLQGSDGYLYISSVTEGANNCGSIVKMSTQGIVADAYDFDCGADGANPYGSLIQSSNGKFYGVTANSAVSMEGVLLELDSSLNLSPLFTFGSDTTLVGPNSGPYQATDGNLYGVAFKGGAFGYGGIYQYTLSGAFSTVFSWNRQAEPTTGFMQHTNGKMYSATYVAGRYNLGTVYALDMGLGPFIALVRYTGRIGQSAQILGQGFTGTTSVTFNGSSAMSFKVWSDTYMTAVVPSGATTGPVVVTTPSGTLTSNKSFRVIP